MAITEDASTPAIATGTGTGNLVSASFSPPAGALVVAFIAAGYANTPTVPGITVADSSGGGNWAISPTQGSSGGSFLGRVSIAAKYFAAAPGSITVTATFTNLVGGRFLAPRVYNGAASDQTGAAKATRDMTVDSTDWSLPFTTTTAGSVVYVMFDDPQHQSPFTAFNANTTIVGTIFENTTDGVTSGLGKSTNPTGTPGAITLGFTDSTTDVGVIAALEILPVAPSTLLSANDLAVFGPAQFPGGMAQFVAALPEQVYTQTPAWGGIAGTTQVITADFNGTSDVRLANNAEAGTPGATVATSDTGSGDPWDAVTIGTGASVVYSSTPDLAGNVGITYDVGVTSSSAFTQWTLGGTASTATPFAGFRFSYAAQFGATCSIFSLNQGGTAVIRVQITATNKLRILDAAGATLYTSTATLTPGAKYFLAVGFLAAVAGTYQLKLYDANGAVLETVTPTAGDFTGPVNLIRYGSVANQTNTNWKALTVDEFSYNSLTMPVPSDQATMAGTTQVVTADFNGTANATGTMAGTTQAVTADFNGTATSGTNTGVLAGTTQVVTADFNGTAKDNGVLGGTTQVVTADFNGTAKGNAVLAGTTQTVTADLNGTAKSSGPIAGIVGVTTADFNGTVKDNAVLGGVVGNVTADLNGTAKSSGPIAGVTQKVTADINGSAAGGYLNGITQPVTADFNGVGKGTGAVAGFTQNVAADFNSLVLDRSILAGVTSGVTADFNGSGKDNGVVGGVVSHVSAHLTGSSPDVTDQSDLMPFFLAERGGYASHS